MSVDKEQDVDQEPNATAVKLTPEESGDDAQSPVALSSRLRKRLDKRRDIEITVTSRAGQ